MSPKKRSTRSVSEQEALSYLKKAEEFYLTMAEAFQKGRWNAAGLAGVHCVISATDALLGKKARIRSSGESHLEGVQLLKQHITDKNVGAQSQRLYRVLSEKSLVEYDSREFREADAVGVVKDVGRYFEWVKTYFPV
jgi:HEPN domain-containing protein